MAKRKRKNYPSLRLSPPRPPDWSSSAACIGLGWLATDDWPPAKVEEARAVCAGCPVLDECREFGLGEGRVVPGILGGLTHWERWRPQCHACPEPAPHRRGSAICRRSEGTWYPSTAAAS